MTSCRELFKCWKVPFYQARSALTLFISSTWRFAKNPIRGSAHDGTLLENSSRGKLRP